MEAAILNPTSLDADNAPGTDAASPAQASLQSCMQAPPWEGRRGQATGNPARAVRGMCPCSGNGTVAPPKWLSLRSWRRLNILVASLLIVLVLAGLLAWLVLGRRRGDSPYNKHENTGSAYVLTVRAGYACVRSDMTEKYVELQRAHATPTPTAAPTPTVLLPTTWTSYRLPTFAVPSHYNLWISTNIETGVYFGVEDITVTVRAGPWRYTLRWLSTGS